MSPEEAMQKPWINITTNWLLSSLTVFLLYWFGIRDKASENRLEEIDSKVSKVEMQAVIKAHEDIEEAKIKQLEIRIENNTSEIAENEDEINDVKERILEELQGLRREVIDLYKQEQKR